MTVFVVRDGQLVEKQRRKQEPAMFPTPAVSRFEGYASPIDDRWISSDRERERDLAANNAYDPRDVRERPNADRTGRQAGDNLWGKWSNDAVRSAEKPA